jgi:hypothetical protein
MGTNKVIFAHPKGYATVCNYFATAFNFSTT